jgi:hypothetical protein
MMMMRPSVHLAAGLAAGLLTALAIGPARRALAQSPYEPHAERRFGAQSKLVPQKQWEYLILPCIPAVTVSRSGEELEALLSNQGKRGWELVALTPIQEQQGGTCVLATLKREVLN